MKPTWKMVAKKQEEIDRLRKENEQLRRRVRSYCPYCGRNFGPVEEKP